MCRSAISGGNRQLKSHQTGFPGAHNARTTRLAAMVGRRGLPRGWRILAVADLTGEGDEVLLVVEGGTARDLVAAGLAVAIKERAD